MVQEKSRVAVFIGPTLKELSTVPAWPERCVVLPPIQRGGLDSLDSSFGSVLIVDGYFHSVPAVGHLEIRGALDRFRIWGCSSMGAIRAFEMREFGMCGLGQVYDSFVRNIDFSDDEVALLHAPEPLYYSISEPLVNIRNFLAFLVNNGDITEAVSQSVIGTLKKMYFGYRTTQFLEDLLSSFVGREQSQKFVAQIAQHRVKGADFVSAFATVMNET